MNRYLGPEKREKDNSLAEGKKALCEQALLDTRQNPEAWGLQPSRRESENRQEPLAVRARCAASAGFQVYAFSQY